MLTGGDYNRLILASIKDWPELSFRIIITLVNIKGWPNKILIML